MNSSTTKKNLFGVKKRIVVIYIGLWYRIFVKFVQQNFIAQQRQ
jgi:hypothetical protein